MTKLFKIIKSQNYKCIIMINTNLSDMDTNNSNIQLVV